MPNRWTDEQQTRAVDLYGTDGLAAAHHTTGIPRSTIVGWARARGVTAGGAEHAAQKTEAALETRARMLADSRERRISYLASAAELALRAIVGRLNNPDTVKEESLRDLVGVFTRAHHDLALATGEATEHQAVTVAFNVPPPSTSPPRVIAQDDLPAALGI